MMSKSLGVLSTAALLLQLGCLLDSPCAHAVVLTPRLLPATRFEVARRLRGGQARPLPSSSGQPQPQPLPSPQ